MKVVLVLDVGSGGQAGFRSDSFIERIFPASDRSHAITKEVVS